MLNESFPTWQSHFNSLELLLSFKTNFLESTFLILLEI